MDDYSARRLVKKSKSFLGKRVSKGDKSEVKVTEFCKRELGMKSEMIGYKYIHDGLMLILTHKEPLVIAINITEELFEKNNINKNKIEQEMRNIIRNCWKNSKKNFWGCFSGNPPTIEEFFVAAYLELRE